MKTIYELTEQDIIVIIANHFSVPLDSVELDHYKSIEGFRMDEHYVDHVKGKVTIEGKADR